MGYYLKQRYWKQYCSKRKQDEELIQMLKSTTPEYFKGRPLFFLRPKFYVALLKTFIPKEVQ